MDVHPYVFAYAPQGMVCGRSLPHMLYTEMACYLNAVSYEHNMRMQRTVSSHTLCTPGASDEGRFRASEHAAVVGVPCLR